MGWAALVLAGAVAQGAATAPTTVEPAPAYPAWLRVEHDPQPAAKIWLALLRAKDFKPIAYTHVFGQMQHGDGKLAGEWRFFGIDREPGPRAAYRLRRPESPPYVVHVTSYCDDAGSTQCAEMRAALATMRSPPPSRVDAAVREEWVRMVFAEPCEPGPEHMPPPTGVPGFVHGTVVLELLVNRCGEVRDVNVLSVAGDRSLRLVADKIRDWRVALPAGETRGGRLRVPIRFGDAVDATSAETR